MRKTNFIILAAVALLIAVTIFMAFDFFSQKRSNKNLYEYEISNLKYVDSALVQYTEIQQISTGIAELKAIAIDRNDNVYATGTGKVLIYNNKGTLIKMFETGVIASCMAISPAKEIFIGLQSHIEVWDTTGVLLRTWQTLNDLVVITAVAVTDSSVFVADAGNRIVYHYNINGELQNEIGKKDTLHGVRGFVIPSPYFDLAIGSYGELWVANPGRHSLEAYTATGELISSWTRTSMSLSGFSGCCNPSHFALLSDGSFVTSEKGLVRIKIHKPAGDFLCVVATPAQFADDTKGLDIAVNSEDIIWVADPKTKLLRVYKKK